MGKSSFGEIREGSAGYEQSKKIEDLNLFELDNPSKNKLKDRILEHKGLVRIFVHPFFCYLNIEKLTREEIKRNSPEVQLIAMRRGLFKILSLSAEKSPPILIFEEESKLQKNFSQFSEICQNSGNYPYMVPTVKNWSEPSLSAGNFRQAMFLLLKKQWAFLRKEMESLGVEKVIIGGMNLSIEVAREHPHWNLVNAPTKAIKNLFRRQIEEGKENMYFFQHCVGEAFAELGLSKRIHVELSNLAYPDSRRDYRRAK